MVTGVRCPVCHKKLAESLDGRLEVLCRSCKVIRIIDRRNTAVVQ